MLNAITLFTTEANRVTSAETFASHKKRDDLADAFLQAISHAKIDVALTCGQELGSDTRKGVYTSVKGRRPTPAQTSKKKYSLSNIKFFMEKSQYDDFDTFVNTVPGLQASICKHFTSVKQCLEMLRKPILTQEPLKPPKSQKSPKQNQQQA